jgi:hypothetical protein
VPRDVEQHLRQDKAVGGDHKSVGSRLPHPLDAFRHPKGGGLKDRQTSCLRQRFDRPRACALAPAGGTVRLGQHKRDFVTRLQQPRQGKLGERWSAGED